MNVETLLDFWIGQAASDPAAAKAKSKLWYLSSAARDEDLRRRFGTTLTQAEHNKLPEWQATERGQLALVVLLDQMSRNLYRGTAQAFANDQLALTSARALIASGAHKQFSPIEQVFLYHPFEHAEELAAQQQSITLFSELLATADVAWHAQLADFLHHAQEHHDIVARYGRFPHRNTILGRSSSAEEKAFLVGARRFGQ
jgi:uncharacterized protein (DUF924 family)